jgi:hypothetical protein
MSTTFALFRNRITEVDENAEYDEEDYVEMAHRTSNGIRFLLHKAIIEALPDSCPVHPIDNSAQGVYTVGDLKKAYYLKNRAYQETTN